MEKQKWVKPSEHPGDWQEIRVVFGAYLTDEQVRQAGGCIGYALKAIHRGEELSEPRKIKRAGKGRITTARFGYDSTKTASDDPDVLLAFSTAARYVGEGSPIRKTDRAGAGTKGTRLCKGLGAGISVGFLVR
jgi:hypothetical protein